MLWIAAIFLVVSALGFVIGTTCWDEIDAVKALKREIRSSDNFQAVLRYLENKNLKAALNDGIKDKNGQIKTRLLSKNEQDNIVVVGSEEIKKVVKETFNTKNNTFLNAAILYTYYTDKAADQYIDDIIQNVRDNIIVCIQSNARFREEPLPDGKGFLNSKEFLENQIEKPDVAPSVELYIGDTKNPSKPFYQRIALVHRINIYKITTMTQNKLERIYTLLSTYYTRTFAKFEHNTHPKLIIAVINCFANPAPRLEFVHPTQAIKWSKIEEGGQRHDNNNNDSSYDFNSL